MNDVISLEKARIERAVAAAIASMPRSGPVFFNSKKLRRAAERIAALEACPVAGSVTVDQVLMALGEGLDIWPASIADDDSD